MASGSYEIAFDEQSGILHLTLRGFWTEAVFEAFRAELVQTGARLQSVHPSYPVLSDSREFAVQSAAVADRLGELMAAAARVNSGRVAVVVGSMLNKKQAERSLAVPGVRVFVERDEAVAWLTQ